MEIEDGYPAMTRELERIIRSDHALAKARYFMNPEGLAVDMRYPSQHNQTLYDLVASPDGAYLRVTTQALVAAQKTLQRQREAAKREEARLTAKAQRDAERAAEKQRKEDEKRERAERRQMETIDALTAELGGVPITERDFVDLRLGRKGTTMAFDRQYRDGDGRPLTAEKVRLDLHLTAADLSLVKPRGELLSATNIDRAFDEWAIAQREDCVARVCERVYELPDGVDRETVLADFARICTYYFREPAFAAKAMEKLIWQAKRMLLDAYVEHRHMVVWTGEQGSGKTYLQRKFADVIGELVAEASLKDVLDERQMELPCYGMILLDELVGTGRADFAALKNFITGSVWARRPMRSNSIEKIGLRASLLGTSNLSLGSLVFDASGMRRFIELEVLPRSAIEPHWHEIKDFNWGQLWQAVDINADDPLMSEFQDVVLAKQEELRAQSNTEQWMLQQMPTRVNAHSYGDDFVEHFATELYTDFREWEKDFDRAWHGTSLTRWGREAKALIDSGRTPHWSYRKYGNKTLYRQLVVDAASAPDGQVLRIKPRDSADI